MISLLEILSELSLSPPQYGQKNKNLIYRGITQEEADFIIKNGYIKSDQRWCVPGEGTCFSDNYYDAESYVNFGRTDPEKTKVPTYVIEIGLGTEIEKSKEGYMKTPHRIPIERITRAWKFKKRDEPIPIKFSREIN